MYDIEQLVTQPSFSLHLTFPPTLPFVGLSKPFLARAFVAIDLSVLQHFLDEYYKPEAISKYMNRNLNGEYLKTNESMGPGGLWTRMTQITLFLSLK